MKSQILYHSQTVHRTCGPGTYEDWKEWALSFFLWGMSSRVWNRVIRVWKPLGKTPLEVVEQTRRDGLYVFGAKVPVPPDVPIAYAGRLDPMAEGVLLLLVGDRCKEIAHYRDHDKTYRVEVLLGVTTDTGDLLGLVREPLRTVFKIPDHDVISRILGTLVGTHEWEYPVFSSKTVHGKPLFRWYYESRLHEIEIPKRAMTIYDIRCVDTHEIFVQELLKQVHARIAYVTKVEDADKEWGKDFRRAEVLATWDRYLESVNNQLPIVTIECRCGSGTYMRTLAEKIGEILGVPACAFSITRTQVG